MEPIITHGINDVSIPRPIEEVEKAIAEFTGKCLEAGKTVIVTSLPKTPVANHSHSFDADKPRNESESQPTTEPKP